ncbi:CBS domain-containing protein [Flavobacterium arcticum]|uniref:CBS domain-containing protein n=1 Tax=Flavobacterium arcticum TaxID=1784713 RepID=A0A345HBT4_9FLAO|nr:CBS domain-containing protein [Flavobacterium arcticum]AXG74044.1 CBS domain-containing protein [Flavobacterium arcticum]KAF2509019.1 CBS domain-containing protein [Flavobacterium arcticum]
MPRPEFIDLVNRIKKEKKSRKMSKRDFIWLFDWYEKRTSGNVWRINEFLEQEKLEVVPNFQNGWIDHEIEIREIDKVKITHDCKSEDEFDPISRLSILPAASKNPTSITKESDLTKAYHLMWKNNFSQLPVMNDSRKVLGIISWESIAKGLIAKKKSNQVKDFMTNDFKVLNHNTSLFEAIKEVFKCGVIFVTDIDSTIKGPVTTFDVNEEYIEKIEPYILLEQIENFIRLFLHDKLILKDIKSVLKERTDNKKIESIGDLTFGEYILVLENDTFWDILNLPFIKSDFVNELHEIRNIRNRVMHFSAEGGDDKDLELLKTMSNFLKDYHNNC